MSPGEASDLVIEDGHVAGVELADGRVVRAGAVVITTGTFLRGLIHIGEKTIAAIAPLTTVYGSETVNPLTAPARVLAALPGVDASRLQAFLQMRGKYKNSTDATGLISMLGSAEQYLAVKTPPVVSIHLTARLANGFAQAAQAVVVPAPEGSQPYRLLLWTPITSQSGG